MNSKIFSTFSVVLLVLGRPERSSTSTDTRRTLKHECHSKTTVWLQECSPKPSRSISGVSVLDLLSFTQKIDADTLLDFATHCKQNET
jgi:hypothetical protein